MSAPTKILTYDERATWGECPACEAKHGEPCNPDRGIQIGFMANGKPFTEGAHLVRLNNAPRKVKLIPV